MPITDLNITATQDTRYDTFKIDLPYDKFIHQNLIFLQIHDFNTIMIDFFSIIQTVYKEHTNSITNNMTRIHY